MKNFTILLVLLIASVSFTKAADLPLDFESGTFEFGDFDGGVLTVIDNPQSSGLNTSAKVLQMVKSDGQTWGGSVIALDNPIDFSSDKKFKMKVYSPRVGAKVLLKVENLDENTIAFEKEVLTTVDNAWEELVFDYSLIDVTKSYQKIVLIFDNGVMGDGSTNFTFLMDDITLFSDGTITIAPSLPIDFESTSINYDFVDFDGGAATVIPNPQSSGINTSATVAQLVRNGGAIWGGSKVVIDKNIDFSTMGGLSMKVFTTAPVGTLVKFKLEGSQQTEKDMLTTVSGEWETIVWDFTGSTSGVFNALAFMFDFGNVGDGSSNSTFLFDDVQQLDLSGGLSQIDLPVNFDSDAINYTVTDFGGSATVLGVDPTNSNNKVAVTTKTAGAATWAGTTIGTALGFKTVIPFTTENTKISVKVYSPVAGIPVRLKAEDHRDETLTVETEATTTVSNAWETLIFDMSNVAAGTNPFNLATSFDKVSIFFNFGVEGADKVYYWDDVMFGTSTPVFTAKAEQIQVYGSNGMLHVNSNNEFVNGTLEVYSLAGKMLNNELISGSNNSIQMDNKGVFIVRILDANQNNVITRKVLIN